MKSWHALVSGSFPEDGLQNLAEQQICLSFAGLGANPHLGPLTTRKGLTLLPKHRLLGPFEMSFDTWGTPVGCQRGSRTAMPLTAPPACGQPKGARVFWHCKKVNSGHFRKYLAFACCGKAQTDKSPTLAVVSASFFPKEIKVQAAFLLHF